MVDRGLRRGFDPAVDHEAREASAFAGVEDGRADRAADARGTERRDLRALPTFTVDPASARDFDDAISAVEEPDGTRQSVGAHRRRVGLRALRLSARPGGLPARDERVRSGRRRADAAAGALQPRLLAGSRTGPPGRHGRDGDRRDDRVRQPAFYRSVIRSDERLDYDRVDRMFAGQETAGGVWGPGLACARAAAAALAARRAATGALEIESSEPEFEFDDRGDVVSIEPVEQTESHRMIEHLMIAANEQVARFLTARRVPTLYRVHERPDGSAAERLIDQLASLGVPTPPVPKGNITPAAGGGLVGEASQPGGAAGRRATAGRGRRALNEPGAALAQAGLLRPAQPRSRRPAAGQLLPLHLADPPLSRPDLSPRAAFRSWRGRSRRPRRQLGRRRRGHGARPGNARRCRSSATQTTSRGASCSSGA